MKYQPLVSIIMNCYNGEEYLDESLKSIINQSYQNWELIFWDNLSTDNSKKIFEKYKDERFKYFRAQEHSVLYQARNLAIQKTNGDVIAFLDTDDVWLSAKLEKQIPLFSDPEVGLVYGNCWLLNESNIFKKRKIFSKKKLPIGTTTKALLEDYKVGLLTIMIRKNFIENIKNVFNVNYDLLADFDFVIRFSFKFKFNCIQEPIAIYRKHNKQLQRKLFSNQIDQLEKWFLDNLETLNSYSTDNLKNIKNKIQYMKILKLINQRKYLKSFFEIIKYPLGIKKLKLIVIFIVPDFILQYYRDYT